MVQVLNYKRNVNLFNRGNPDRVDRVLNTVGIGKAISDVIVPNVVGMGLDPATTTLAAAGLSTQAFGDTSTTVVSQSPAAAVVVPPESTVNILFGPWPERIVNGTFDTDLASWEDLSISPSQVIWNATAKAMFRGLSADTYAGLLQQVNIGVSGINKAFKVGFDASSLNAGGGYVGRFIVGTITQPYKYVAHTITQVGPFEAIIYPTEVDVVVRITLEGNGSSFLIDNVSLKRYDNM